jgi:hypothetical protein
MQKTYHNIKISQKSLSSSLLFDSGKVVPRVKNCKIASLKKNKNKIIKKYCGLAPPSKVLILVHLNNYCFAYD